MIKEIAQQLKDANRFSEAILTEIRQQPSPDLEYLVRRLTDYCVIKLRLPEEERSDNLILMLQLSVSHALNTPVEKLPSVDQPGICGGSTAVMSQRIQLLLSVQKGLGFHMDPKLAPHIKTVRDLADVVQTALASMGSSDAANYKSE